MKNKKAVLLLIVFLLSIVVLCAVFLFLLRVDPGIDEEAERELKKVEVTHPLTVHFIDAGQGDATLLQGPDFTILIDAGRHDDDKVIRYLKSTSIQHLDLLIGTHPHADHIGQFPQIMEAYPVNEVWMSGDVHTTRTFERALDAILESDTNYTEPRAGESYTIGSAIVDVLHPGKLNGDLNHGSIVVRITFSDVSILFMGDAELLAEEEILRSEHPVQVDILKIGHHGSRSSSSKEFLQKVDPDIAIYSAARGNSYGHPHPEVMERLTKKGMDVYGTDMHGTIRIVSDGLIYSVELDQGD